MKLKRIIAPILLLFAITIYLAYRANLFSISDWLQFFILWALAVVAVLSLYDLIHKERDNKLREIDNQLLTLYYPLCKAIRDFQKKVHFSASDSSRIDNDDGLETAIRDIKTKTVYRLDSRTNEEQKKFFGSPTEYNLKSIFLYAVKLKITELENERQKYE